MSRLHNTLVFLSSTPADVGHDRPVNMYPGKLLLFGGILSFALVNWVENVLLRNKTGERLVNAWNLNPPMIDKTSSRCQSGPMRRHASSPLGNLKPPLKTRLHIFFRSFLMSGNRIWTTLQTRWNPWAFSTSGLARLSNQSPDYESLKPTAL